MSKQQEGTRQSSLINKLVLDRQTTEEIGRVEEMSIDPVAHKILGLVCKSGLFGRQKQVFMWDQIHSIGKDSIIVSPGSEARAQKPESAQQVLGREVWADSGDKVGNLQDCVFDLQTGDIVEYLFVSNGWRGITEGIYCFPPEAILGVGKQRVMVSRASVETPQLYAEGLGQKISQARDFLKDDYERTQQHLKQAVEGSQSLAKGLQQANEQAKETLAGLTPTEQENTSASTPPAAKPPENSSELKEN